MGETGAVIVLDTDVPGLTLRAHRPQDAENLQALLADNAEHLRTTGDYDAEIGASVEDWRAEFAAGREPTYSFAILPDGVGTVGRVVLLPIDPTRCGLGHWMANPQQGKGIATPSVVSVVTYAATALGAREVSAGVRRGNVRSVRVLETWGLLKMVELAEHTCCLLPDE